MAAMTTFEKKNEFMNKVQTAMLSFITMLVSGCFIFLWNLNATISVLQEKTAQQNEMIQGLTGNYKFLNDVIRADEQRINNIEVTQNQKKP